MKTNKPIEIKWMHFKVSTLTAAITTLLLSGVTSPVVASDIDIYQSGGTGATTIYLMLDVSGSMNQKEQLYDDYDFEYRKNGDWKYYTCWEETGDLNLKINGYKYTRSSDRYCEVNLSDITAITTDKADDYRKKIRATCDVSLSNPNKYTCLSRIVKLRKGLITLVTDSSIDENIYLGLGTYSGDSATHEFDFKEMSSTNKSSLVNIVQRLSAGSYTPISAAYKLAGQKFNSTSNSNLNARLECSGNGIYFLTDGVPSYSATDYNYNGNKVMTNKLGSSISSSNWENFWNETGYYAQSIRSSGYKIKTATVGFGSGYLVENAELSIDKKKYFDCTKVSSADSNERKLCQWGAKTIPNRTDVGGFGEGGFYTAQSSQDLVASLKTFVSEVKVDIEGTTIGSSTIPVDALNTSQLQPYAYFPMFKPLIGSEDQLWAGNLKKFNVLDGSLYDTKKKAVFKNKQDINDELEDYWYNSSAIQADKQLSFGGSLSQLLGKKMPTSTEALPDRNVLINSGTNGQLESVKEVVSTGALADKDYLFGLLGYSHLTTAELTELLAKSNYQEKLEYLKTKLSTAKGFQKGAVIHSSPILLTQAGAIVQENGSLTSAERKDYVLYGTTQGVIHVVRSGSQKTQVVNGVGIDSTGGEEVFAFVPKEMLAKQKTGFFDGHAQNLTANGFFYGVDAPWEAHTVYEPSFYEVQKTDANGVLVFEDEAKTKPVMVSREGLAVVPNSTASHQYVYGGLRMGGRSYYALNLSDIANPKMLFHIDPDNAASNSPISYMGQSWSKPTLTYIKWNGKKKLAMIVGGGYEAGLNNTGGYENPDFVSSSSTPVKGNGVYIFDAENGDLLWWGSSRAATTDATVSGDRVTAPAATNISSMMHSIPSRVKVIDRDSDGVADHLYVGDLGGNLFRIDLNVEHHIKASQADAKPVVNFIKNAVSLAQIKEVNKNPVRFFEAPTFTVHSRTNGTKFAVLTMSSGDRGSPLKTSSIASQDVIVGVYDDGVTALNPTVPTTPIGLSNLKEIYTKSTATGGWYYKLPKATETSGSSTITYQPKGLSEGVALDNDLYYSVFDPQKKQNSEGSSNSCSGGIVGESIAYQLCLPSGECSGGISIKTIGNLGAGIISLAVGTGSTQNSRKLIMNDPSQGGSNVPEYSTKDGLIPTRWYEYSPAYKKVN